MALLADFPGTSALPAELLLLYDDLMILVLAVLVRAAQAEAGITLVRVRVRVIESMMDRVLVEVHRLDIMLIVVVVVKLVVRLVIIVVRDSLVVVVIVVVGPDLVRQSLAMVRIVHFVHVLSERRELMLPLLVFVVLRRESGMHNWLLQVESVARLLLVMRCDRFFMVALLRVLLDEVHRLVHQAVDGGLRLRSLDMLVAVESLVYSMLMEVHWLNVVLVVKGMVKLVVSLVILMVSLNLVIRLLAVGNHGVKVLRSGGWLMDHEVPGILAVAHVKRLDRMMFRLPVLVLLKRSTASWLVMNFGLVVGWPLISYESAGLLVAVRVRLRAIDSSMHSVLVEVYRLDVVLMVELMVELMLMARLVLVVVRSRLVLTVDEAVHGGVQRVPAELSPWNMLFMAIV